MAWNIKDEIRKELSLRKMMQLVTSILKMSALVNEYYCYW